MTTAMASLCALRPDIPEEVDHIFEEIAARFRQKEKKGGRGGNAAPHRQTIGGAGTTAEVSHDN